MMKRFVRLFIFSSLFMGLAIQARVSDQTLAQPVPMTAEKLLLQQVDTVCLYLSTSHIVYVPEYQSENKRFLIKIALLDITTEMNHGQLRKFVLRHIEAFQKELKKRLNFYAPELAAEFNEQEDLRFLIQRGAEKKTIGRFENNVLNWYEDRSEAPAAAESQATEVAEEESVPATPVEALEPSDCKKRCPALVGHSVKKEEPVVPESEPLKVPQKKKS